MSYVFKCNAFINHPSACSLYWRTGKLLCCHSCPRYETCIDRCENMVHKCGKNEVEKDSVKPVAKKKRGGQYRKVVQYDLERNKLAVYDSVTDAADAVGVTPSCISLACRGRSKTAGGYVWRYENDSETE